MFHLHSQIPLFHRFNKIGNGTLVSLFQTTKCIMLVVVIGTILHQKVEFIPMFYMIHFKNIYLTFIRIPSKILELEKNNLRYSVTIKETFVY